MVYIMSHSLECPVCLHNQDENIKFIVGPCRHAICVPCMERIVYRSSSGNRGQDFLTSSPDDLDNVIVTNMPLRGRCPMCRGILSLIDLCKYNPDEEFQSQFDFDFKPLRGSTFFLSMDNAETELPWIQFLSFPSEGVPFVLLSGGEQLIHFEQQSCIYHAKSQTFSGTLKTFQNQTWSISVQFSSGLKCICRGGIAIESTEVGPMDGQWRVTWPSVPQESAAEIEVGSNCFSLYGKRYRIELGHDENGKLEKISFMWPDESQNIVQTLNSINGGEIFLGDNGLVGEAEHSMLKWTTSHDEVKEIHWQRIHPPTVKTNRLFVPLCPSGGALYMNRHKVTESENAKYKPESLWGNTFIQGNTFGMAAYHFEIDFSPPYISYDNIMCSLTWPTLDDGQPIPSRIYFKQLMWDSKTRTFEGVIDWMETHGTTWQGMSSWTYQMVFDTNFMCILSGNIVTKNATGTVEMSRFGSDLIYLNAALKDKFKDLDDHERQESIRKELSRLEAEGISPMTEYLLQDVLS